MDKCGCGHLWSHHLNVQADGSADEWRGTHCTIPGCSCPRFLAASEPVIEVCPSCGRRNPKVREYDYNDGPEGYVWVRCDACGDDWGQPSEATLQAARDGVLTVAQPAAEPEGQPTACEHVELHDDVVMTVVQREGVWRCYQCGQRFVFRPAAQWADVVALVKKWRVEAETRRTISDNDWPIAAGQFLCAAELERVTKGEG